MQKTGRLTLCLLGTLLFYLSAEAQQPIRWEVSLDNAKRAAAQSNRLILAQFTAPWCGACRVMENEVFSQASVAAAIEANYVPVKINVEYFPATARQYGVTALPTTIIMAPTAQGEALDSMRGVVKPDEYAARLSQVAANSKGRSQAVLAQIPGGPATGTVPAPTAAPSPSPNFQPAPSAGPVGQMAGPGAAADQAIPLHSAQPSFGATLGRASPPASPPTAFAASPTGPPLVASGPTNPSPPVGPMATPPVSPSPVAAGPTGRGSPNSAPAFGPGQSASPYAQASAGPPPATPSNPSSPPLVASRTAGASHAAIPIHLPPDQPPLGLDGFCPVRLMEARRWSIGDGRWGARHRGRTYLFAGPEEQRKFLADPDRFAPVNSGEDLVLAVEQTRKVPGTRAQGVTYGGHVYLFAEEATRLKFSQNPRFYAERALQALRAGEPMGQQMR